MLTLSLGSRRKQSANYVLFSVLALLCSISSTQRLQFYIVRIIWRSPKKIFAPSTPTSFSVTLDKNLHPSSQNCRTRISLKNIQISGGVRSSTEKIFFFPGIDVLTDRFLCAVSLLHRVDVDRGVGVNGC